MSPSSHGRSPDDHQGPCPDDQALSRLERLLTRQLVLARSEDLEGFSAAFGEVDDLLRQAAQAPRALSAEQARKLAAIRRLRHQIGLVLAAKREDIARQLRHAGRGRKTLRAYRQGTA